MRSISSETEALNLFNEVKALVARGGFNLTSVISNPRELLQSLGREDLRIESNSFDFLCEHLPTDHALGVTWDVENDTFAYKVNLVEKPFTRRGILSTIHSIYDPLGLIDPAIIPSKKIFQESCSFKLDWNDN